METLSENQRGRKTSELIFEASSNQVSPPKPDQKYHKKIKYIYMNLDPYQY